MRFFPLSLAGLAVIVSSCGPPPGPVGLEPANVMGAPAQTVAVQDASGRATGSGLVSGDPGTTAVASTVPDGSCNAALYQNLVGEPIAVVNSLNTGVRTRVLTADAFVTRDFDPNRLTFTTTRQDTVGRVFCG